MVSGIPPVGFDLECGILAFASPVVAKRELLKGDLAETSYRFINLVHTDLQPPPYRPYVALP